MDSFNPHSNLMRGATISLNWAEEKTKAWRGCHLSKAVGLLATSGCMTTSGTGIVSRALELAGDPGSIALLGP